MNKRIFLLSFFLLIAFSFSSSQASAIQHAGFDLILDVPSYLRAGDWEMIRLDVIPLDEIANAESECCAMIIESRLEVSGAEISPMDIVSEPIAKGGRAIFFWRIRTEGDDPIRGEVKTYLRLIPIDGGAESRALLSAQEIVIRPLRLFGLDGSTSRVLGWLGLGISFILWLPILSRKIARTKFHN